MTACILCRVYRPSAEPRSRVWPDRVCQGCRCRVGRELDELTQMYAMLPTVLPPGGGRGERVSGTASGAVPVSLTAIDLSMPARPGSRGLFVRGVLGLDDDQIGDLSVATVLDTWVRDWSGVLDHPRPLPPRPTVPALTGWLHAHLDQAVADHPAIDEFAAEVHDLRSTLRAVLGLYPARPEPVLLVPCRDCDLLTLIRVPGSPYIECGNCPALLTTAEFRRWAGLVAEHAGRVGAPWSRSGQR